ncbi:AcrR family transcriptional regulator [Amycolatopsis lexingtonensis]|uniref:AcrR family transcriptional regulator n=1 Tax=Amycolatopsis lexingtonensis TaxID=218822 RepID=A0ABR9HYR3_9PSEU|nr:TetR/AcrR family transcriptional regulator [Amycolatopsis lexingtonensis]MBE1496079.1 AcrR family transcriptional regulator [Amycolatopsis lexingtonensis]
MTSSPSPAASAPRTRGRPAVPLDRILATALQLVDEEGAEALSMRTLAQRLESGTATLYRHFGNRATLITQVIDRVFGEIELDPGALAELSWDRACQAVARAMFDTLGKHRKIAPLLIEQTPTGPNAMVLRERCLAVLLGGGLPPNVAVRAYATLSRYVLGFAIQLSGSGNDAERERVSTRFHDVSAGDFPATHAVADSLPVPLEDEFAFGLELIINGLRQLHAR